MVLVLSIFQSNLRTMRLTFRKKCRKLPITQKLVQLENNQFPNKGLFKIQKGALLSGVTLNYSLNAGTSGKCIRINCRNLKSGTTLAICVYNVQL